MTSPEALVGDSEVRDGRMANQVVRYLDLHQDQTAESTEPLEPRVFESWTSAFSSLPQRLQTPESFRTIRQTERGLHDLCRR